MNEDKLKVFLKHELLPSPELLNNDEISIENIQKNIIRFKHNLVYINKDILDSKTLTNLDILEFEKAVFFLEKYNNPELYNLVLKKIKGEKEKDIYNASEYPLEILSYEKPLQQISVSNFVNYFNKRFEFFSKILSARDELVNLHTIKRIAQKKDKEKVSLIGLVSSKKFTKTGNFIIELEDKTGIIRAIINNNKKELIELAKEITEDEVIGITGIVNNKNFYVENIIFPDIPLNKEKLKIDEDVYIAVISDLHIGSDKFLENRFNRFLDWLNLKIGNEKQKEIASKLKYIFIVGDLVDGVGIYPEQDSELVIKDIYEQYERCAELLSKIPKHIKIIACPGNHDAVRLSEPQPAFDKEFAKPLFKLKNFYPVTNPSYVNIMAKDNFKGFLTLLYHGYSFDYYINNIESLKLAGGYEKPHNVMKFLLKKRHLAPTHKSTLYIPDNEEDPLIIKKIPDFFFSGHTHHCSVGEYRNITLVSSSCWQDITPYQEKTGHRVEPGKLPLINLKTREIKILKF